MRSSIKSTKKRNSAGYVRASGRCEGRYRPKTRVEITTNHPELADAFRGLKDGFFKYEFLNYFDTLEEKDIWLDAKRNMFNEQVQLSQERASRDAPEKIAKTGTKRKIISLKLNEDWSGRSKKSENTDPKEIQDLMPKVSEPTHEPEPLGEQPPIKENEGVCHWFCRGCKTIVPFESHHKNVESSSLPRATAGADIPHNGAQEGMVSEGKGTKQGWTLKDDGEFWYTESVFSPLTSATLEASPTVAKLAKLLSSLSPTNGSAGSVSPFFPGALSPTLCILSPRADPDHSNMVSS